MNGREKLPCVYASITPREWYITYDIWYNVGVTYPECNA